MPILAFQKPDKVIMLEADNSFGKFEFRPLEPGYGQTIGNALRRILLSSLGGFAICSIRIGGVAHELDTIPGVKQDVTNIILNLKQVRFKQLTEDHETEKGVINVSGTDVLKAGDLGKVLSGFEVLNPDLEICRLDPSASFQMEFTINKGRGWVPADENREILGDTDPSVIAIDCIESYRVFTLFSEKFITTTPSIELLSGLCTGRTSSTMFSLWLTNLLSAPLTHRTTSSKRITLPSSNPYVSRVIFKSESAIKIRPPKISATCVSSESTSAPESLVK